METLENKIISFQNWSLPWTFYDFIISDKTLNESELNLFKEIWNTASDFELWNERDLTLGCEASRKYVTKNYNLSDIAVANIIRAISYQWK